MRIKIHWEIKKPNEGEKSSLLQRAVLRVIPDPGKETFKESSDYTLHVTFEGHSAKNHSPRIQQLFTHRILEKTGIPRTGSEGYPLQIKECWGIHTYQKEVGNLEFHKITNDDPDNNLPTISCLNHTDWWNHLTAVEIPELLKHPWIKHSGMPELALVLLLKGWITEKEILEKGFIQLHDKLTGQDPRAQRNIHITPKTLGRRLENRTIKQILKLTLIVMGEIQNWKRDQEPYIETLCRKLDPKKNNIEGQPIPFARWYVQYGITPNPEQIQAVFSKSPQILDWEKSDIIKMLRTVPLAYFSNKLSGPRPATAKKTAKVKTAKKTRLEIIQQIITAEVIPEIWIQEPKAEDSFSKINRLTTGLPESIVSQQKLVKQAVLLKGLFFDLVRQTAAQQV
jgi:hypothetical protein